ncbi:WD40-repeat-containing domain protein [Favolaschia claudopus]|uniref:WD40-repeat-containing domain protein n=1 Tax=Favolaschia claudopus TaxID=2862362 RepID=A0AAW0AG36_9AGAR
MSQRPYFGNAALDGFITALDVTKEVSVLFPPLQAAVGGMRALIEVFQRAAANQDNIQTLTAFIARLNQVMTTSMPDAKSSPDALKRRLEQFSDEVQQIAKDIIQLGSQSYPLQVLKGESVEGEIGDKIRSLSWCIQNFLDLKFTIRGEFQHVQDRFDRLEDAIGDLKTEMHQLHTSTDLLPRIAIQALFDYSLSSRVSCDVNTRREALATVYHWLAPLDPRLADLPPQLFAVNEKATVFWIYGVAGTGKSTLAQTIANWCDELGLLGASFFCAREGERNNVQLIVPSIVRQLSGLSDTFRAAVVKAMKANPEIHSAVAARQVQKLLVEPLQEADDFPRKTIIIDALDECNDTEAVSVILKALSVHISGLNRLKFLITSRPVPNVDAGFRNQLLFQNTQQFSLADIPPPTTEADIANFLRNRLTAIQQDFCVADTWPINDEIEALVKLAGGLFIFAATAVKFIADNNVNNPEDQLSALLQPSARIPRTTSSPFTHLDGLYLQVLHLAYPNPDHSIKADMKIVLGSITLLRDGLSPGSLDMLFGLRIGSVRRILRGVHSIITVPSAEEPIRVIHKSFSDFLIDPSRCSDKQFLVKVSLQQTVITKACLKTLALLSRDICGVQNESLLNHEIPNLFQRVHQFISPQLQYACRYWASHLQVAEVDQEILDLLDTFCKQKLVNWLEVLSLLGDLDFALEALQSAQEVLKILPLPITDVPRVVHSFYPALSTSCFQAYRCAVPFSPANTLFHTFYSSPAHEPVAIRTVMPQLWKAHTGWVQSVAYSPDGSKIVSGSMDTSLRLWDARTGAQLNVLQGHSGTVFSAVFSPTAKEIIIWDAATGACLETQTWHQKEVRSVAYSPVGNYAASGSYAAGDHTVLTGHWGDIYNVVFSSDGEDAGRLWDVATASHVQELKHELDAYSVLIVMSIAISQDKKIITCGLADGSISMWNSDGSRWIRTNTLQQHGNAVWAVHFSPDDHTFASGSWDRTICLWNSRTGAHLETLHEHSDQVLTIDFSPNGLWLASGSCDTTVRIWRVPQSALHSGIHSHFQPQNKISDPGAEGLKFDVESGTYLCYGPGPEHHASPVRAVAFSPDGSLLATGAWDGKIRLWDVVSGDRRKTLWLEVIPKGQITSLQWSCGGDLIAASGGDGNIRIWDIERAVCVQTATVHTATVWIAHFVGKDKALSSSDDCTIRSWTVSTAGLTGQPEEMETIFQGPGPIYTIALSPESNLILSSALDLESPGSRRGFPTLRLHNRDLQTVIWQWRLWETVASLSFSHDCTRAVCGTGTGIIILLDLTKSSTENPTVNLNSGFVMDQWESGDGKIIEHVSFSSGEHAVVSDSSFTQLPEAFLPLSAAKGEGDSDRCFLLDGWLWRVNHSGRHRLCWVPPNYRHTQTTAKIYMGSMAIKGTVVGFGTNAGWAVIIDASTR